MAAVLLVDQRERWQMGERIDAETYLRMYPGLRDNFEYGLELVYGEFLMGEERGEHPRLEDFQRRFPAYAERLQLQLELHRALAHAPAATTGGTRPAEESAAWPSVPGYEILGELGRGGMGQVYKARHTALNRQVALKMLRARDAIGSEEAERLRAEAEVIASFQHSHIVQIHEIGDHEGRPYLALEYVPGGSLASRLGGTPQPFRTAAELVQTLAGAVPAAHEKVPFRLVHRRSVQPRRPHAGHRRQGPDHSLLGVRHWEADRRSRAAAA